MRWWVPVAAVAVCVLVPAAVGSSPRADRRLDRALVQLVSMAGGPPGVIAVVQRGTRRIVFEHGVADRATGAGISLADHWRIASVSKAFGGAAAVRLVAQGRLNWSDTIAKRLPRLPRQWGRVTLRQALQHTSGLPDFSASDGLRKALTKHPLATMKPSTLLSWVAKEPLRFTPGSKYKYSNTDNVVVAFFIQAATGLPYEQALRKLVLRPLHLRATSLPSGYRMPSPFVHGYSGADDDSEIVSASYSWASGGIVSRPLDLTRFIRWYAPRGQGPFRTGGTSEPNGPGANSAGLAIFRYRTPCGTVYGHTGNTFGYTAFIAASHDGRRSVTILASTQLTHGVGDQKAFQALRAAFSLGVCAALA